MIVAIAEIILPVFLVIAAGYIACARAWMAEHHIDGLMRFTQRFAIPCLLFNAIAQIDLTQAFNPKLLAAFYGAALISFALGVLGARLMGRNTPDAVAIGFGALFSNSVLLGLPITARAYGVEALDFNFAIIAFHAPICYIVGVAVMGWAEARAGTTPKGISQNLNLILKNALIIGIALGFAFNLSGLNMPDIAQSALDLVVQSALPVALFALGGVLYRYRPEGDQFTIAMVVGLSLLLHPALTFGFASAFALSDAALRSAVLTAAMPPGINVYLFADLYARGKRVAASAVLFGSLLSVVTAALWISLLPPV